MCYITLRFLKNIRNSSDSTDNKVPMQKGNISDVVHTLKKSVDVDSTRPEDNIQNYELHEKLNYIIGNTTMSLL